MSEEPESTQNSSPMEIELYFLIAKFLSTGPCSRTAEVLREELKQHKLLPKRIDWEGQEHVRSFENLNETNRHISSNHLLKICQRIVPLLNRDVKPSVEGVMSLLGAGRQSILRTEEDVRVIRWPGSTFVARHHGYPLKPPDNLKYPPNLGPVVHNRQLMGCARFDHALPGQLYSKMTLLSRSLGHLSAVYCVAFDRTGHYIFTGADDHLLKVWSSVNGRLLSTLRGHGAEITDITCSYDNTLLAAGSCDKLIRIWSLQTSAPVAVLHGHTHLITSLRFCPYPRGDTRYLASTGGDGCLCIWEFNRITKIFNPKPIKFIERSRAGTQMLCLSFSPGGVFLATGSTDHVVRVYYFSGNIPEKICELEAHVDRIDSIQYANGDARFLSASKDGTARIWRFVRQEWKAVVLDASLKMSSNDESELRSGKYRVTMACWSADDRYVITAVSDFTLKVWNSFTGELVQVLQPQCWNPSAMHTKEMVLKFPRQLMGHGDEVFVLEHNPIDPRILLSAGHDGNIIIWDMLSGVKIKTFYNMIEGQGHGAVFDCKWSPDGQSFAATDSHGFLLYFGFGSNDKYKRLPEEIFFHTDYRPLIRDGNNYVLDEQTQHPPHMMPPPFLVDIDGNPYPPKFQKLVPGREECQDLMLVPLVVTTMNGDREVVDDLSGEMQAMAVEASEPVEANAAPEERPIIDEMIARMQHEQDQRLGEDQRNVEEGELEHHRNRRAERRDGGRARRTRHSRDVDRMRQRHEDDNPAPQPGAPSNHCIWMKRDLVREVEKSVYVTFEKWRSAKAEEETKTYLHERKKKPLIPSELDSSDSGSYMRTRRHQKHGHGYSNCGNEETGRNRLVTRALYDTETEGSSATEDLSDHERSTSVPIVEQPPPAFGTDSDSTEYSDWVPDDGATLQPPKRRSQRKRRRPRWRSPDDDDSDEMGTDEEGEDEEEDDEEEEEEEEKKDERATPKKKVSSTAVAKKKKKRKSNQRTKEQQKVLDHRNEIREVPNEFRPPEWLTSAMPRKAPYFPQMGDEVIYFMQGHRQYIEAVKANNTYQINPNKAQPWNKQPHLREQELMKVVGIKYEMKPPRLVCLKLAFIDPETSKLTGGTFTIKFHDMPGVIDFVILRQTYDVAMGRNWSVGDRFRCLIDDTWWFGIITSREPFQEEYPDSMFQCMVVHWDNGEQERLSPWDLEPADRHRVPVSRDGSLPATTQEMSAMSYRCKPSDWPSQGCDAECERIVRGLEQIMSLSIAEPFLVPVDLNAFPIYAMIIEYPIDLSTIKERLENRFYRRIAAIQYDVRQIEHNTRTFNEKNSNIVKFSKIVTELCLRLISDPSCYDVMALYNKLTKDSQFAVLSPAVRSEDGSSADESTHRTTREGTSSRRSVNQQMLARSSKRRRRRQNSNMLDPNAWKQDCALLLETMLESDDSIPFRHPVDIDEFPDYLQVVASPMDLGTVRDHLTSGAYDTALDFCKDVRLVFKNSRSYNTNKRSRIYAMTLRLSAMFEDQFQGILAEYNSSNKHRKNPHRTSHRRIIDHGASSSQTRSSHPVFSNFTTPTTADPLSGEVVTSRRRNLPRIQGSSSCSNPRPAKRLRVVSDSEAELHPRGHGSADVSQPSRRIKTRSKVPAKRLKYRGADVSDEEDDEEGLQKHKSEDEVDEEEEEDDSDEDFQVNRRRKQPVKKAAKKPKVKKSSSKKKLMNGSKPSASERYGTRCATGSLKRKRYDRGFSDEEDELSVDEAGKQSRLPNANGRVRVSNSRASHAATSSDSSTDASSSDDSESVSHQSSSGTEEYSDQSGPTQRPTRARTSGNGDSRKLLRAQIADDSSQQSAESSSTRGKSARYSTRNQGRRTVRYQEDSDPDRGDAFLDHDQSDSDAERTVSVSSRGRIRRPNPRIRTSL